MIVDAAHAANVKLLIWSGLVDVNEASQGKYKHVYHCDSKAAITQHAKKTGIRFYDVQAASYMQNYITFSPPRKQPDGSYVIAAPVPPESLVPLIDATADYGLFVRESIESSRGQKAESGDTVSAIGQLLSFQDMAKQLSEGER